MKIATPGVLLVIWLVHCLTAYAGEIPAPAVERADLHAHIERESIYREKAWLALLHYRPRAWGNGWRSQADRGEFFLTRNGRDDPRAELHAAVDALLFDDAAMRCRFPARFRFLQQRLQLQDERNAFGTCTDLRNWYQPLAADRVSINFAAAYLENPSSLFGHTFLRFYAAGSPQLLSPTLNYAADTSQQSGQLDFVARGLFGGFPGVADQLPYFRRLRTYADNEGRDIWEYPLRLTPAQIDLLLLHAWEVKDGSFDYFFLDENCAYRTLALIAAVRPDLDLLEPFDGPVIPVDTIRTLQQRQLLGEPIYWPSSSKLVTHHAQALADVERRQMLQLATGATAPAAAASISPQRRALVMAVAAEYVAIEINRDQLDRNMAKRTVQELLRERIALGIKPELPALTPPPLPERGHAGSVLGIGWAQREHFDSLELTYAPFRHTLMEPLAGYEKNAEVTVLGGSVRVGEGGGMALERIDWLRVSAQMPSTALFQQPAWTLHLSRQRKPLDDARPLLNSLGYAMGRALETRAGVAALTIGADIDGGAALDSSLAVEAQLNLSLTRQSNAFSYQLFYQYGHYIAGEDSQRDAFGVRFGVPLSRSCALQGMWQREGADRRETELTLGLAYYF